MKEIENYLIEFGEELGKEGYSIVKAGVNTLFKAKGELAQYTIDSYKNVRFEIRLRDFAYEQEQLSDKQKQNFYENIDHTQLNYLFELLEQSRTTMFDLHAKILSKIYSNLIRNNGLNNFEIRLLATIDSFMEDDFETIWEIMNVYLLKHKNFNNIYLEEQSYMFYPTYTSLLNKCLNLSVVESHEIILVKDKHKFLNITFAEHVKDLYVILEDIGFKNVDI